jgi:hypothetical protein
MYAHQGEKMDAILLIIGIVYGVCRIFFKSVQQCTYFLFSCESAFSRHGQQKFTILADNAPLNQRQKLNKYQWFCK